MTSHPSGTRGGHDVVEPLPSATIRRPGGRDVIASLPTDPGTKKPRKVRG